MGPPEVRGCICLTVQLCSFLSMPQQKPWCVQFSDLFEPAAFWFAWVESHDLPAAHLRSGEGVRDRQSPHTSARAPGRCRGAVFERGELLQTFRRVSKSSSQHVRGPCTLKTESRTVIEFPTFAKRPHVDIVRTRSCFLSA